MDTKSSRLLWVGYRDLMVQPVPSEHRVLSRFGTLIISGHMGLQVGGDTVV